jgi:hypothetical protein
MDNVKLVLLIISLLIVVYLFTLVPTSSGNSWSIWNLPGVKSNWDFYTTYRPDIWLVVLVIFMILVFEDDVKNLFTEIKKPPQMETNEFSGEVVVEAFSDEFCTHYSPNQSELNAKCRELTDSNCDKAHCCTKHKEQCVAGSNQHGPKFV